MFVTLVYFFSYIYYIQCANILCVLVYPSYSHQIVYQAIWRELSLRGHNVTVVTPNPLDDSSLTNLTEINVSFVYEVLNQTTIQNFVPKNANIFEKVTFAFHFMKFVVEAHLNNIEFQNLINNRNNKFDLILTEWYFPVLYGLSQKFAAPMISVSSTLTPTSFYNVFGSPNHPILYPDIILSSYKGKFILWEKIRNVVFGVWITFYHYYYLLPRDHEIARKYFGDDISYIGILENNLSMLHLYSNPIVYPPRPNVPTTLEMGQLHLKPTKPLPKDLQEIMDEASQGVIYFSLGTNVKSIYLSEKLRKIIIDALSELPYIVIWKWEGDSLPGKPSNIIVRKWLPQQDILSHPNICAFVTQGGMQSIEEAISRAVPLVGLPFYSDQFANVEKIVKLGVGVGLDHTSVTTEELKKSIIEVSQNYVYKERIEKIRSLLFDSRFKSIEEVIWWCEYVIRHKGARHLKSPSADISWFAFLLMDVVIILTMVVMCVLFIMVKLIVF